MKEKIHPGIINNVISSGEVVNGMKMANDQLVQRCVIIQRDETGYGLTVTGDNPVYVQSVKEGGAACRAGVRQGDRIVKVNGRSVTSINHMDVVKMISGGSHAALTLLSQPSQILIGTRQRPVTLLQHEDPEKLHPLWQPALCHGHEPVIENDTALSPPSSGSPASAFSCSSGTTSSITSFTSSAMARDGIAKDSISEYISENTDKQMEWKKKRAQIIRQMLEEEKKHVEELNSELQLDPNNEKTRQSLEQAQRRIGNLENQLSDFGNQMLATTTTTTTVIKPEEHRKQPDMPPPVQHVVTIPKQKSLRQKKAQIQSSVSEHARMECNSGQPARKSQTMQFVSPAQIDVVPMEDSDSDTEIAAPLEMEGPFSNFAELKGRPAHLAVFMHYLISNSDPASLLFYLVSDLYSQGNGKDLRKWAYEIHSSFLVPTAPLRVSCIENVIWQEVEHVLDSPGLYESQELMKRLFVRSRGKALDEINEHLADFRGKRNLGLGTVFGENMLRGLMEGDLAREKKIVDSLLTPHLDSFFTGVSDFDSLPDRTQVLAASLATILKHLGVKPAVSSHEKLLDKCPSYAAKEKSRFGLPLISKPSKKAVQIKGHQFLVSPVYSSTKCYQCTDAIWGFNAQAYFCSGCDVIVHKQCARNLDDACSGIRRHSSTSGSFRSACKKSTPQATSTSHIPSTPTKDSPRTDPSLSTASPVVCSPPITIPAKHHQSQQQRLRQPRRNPIAEEPEDGSVSTGAPSAPDDSAELCDQATDLPTGSPTTGSSASGPDWPSKATWSSADSGYGGDCTANATTIIGRSQSMRTEGDQARAIRNNAAGNNGRRANSDVGAKEKSGKIDQVATGQDQDTEVSAITHDTSVSSNLSNATHNSFQDSPTRSIGTTRPQSDDAPVPAPARELLVPAVLTGSECDLDGETDCPRLEDVLDWETVRRLKPKERKRQEVINELFHTEKTHVRNLKVLHKIFYERMLVCQVLPADFIKLLFANIEDILGIHGKMNVSMQALTKKSKLVGEIGETMLKFFDSKEGENFGRAVATFCQHQQYALEALKFRVKKDQKLSLFLQEAEMSPACRKLQLKDMLPMEMQRLTKYPLLLETAAKYTTEPSEEVEKLQKCVECVRVILDKVNTAKRKSEDTRRLEELQKRLDTMPFDKVQHPMVQDYRGLDLRRHRLVHDGLLTWRLSKNKAVDLHVVLLEDLLVLMTRNSDGQRLSLRFHNITFVSLREDSKFTHCPLLKLSSLIAKNVATDKKAFFLVSTSALGPQIYEMVAQSTAEKKTWFRFITEQIENCRRSDPPAAAGHRDHSSIGANAIPTKTPNQLMPQNPEEIRDPAGRKLSEAGVPVAAASSVTHGEAPMEMVQVISQPRLINPNEVRVCQPTILEHAEPILTPLERLRRKDEAILRALIDKQQLLSKIFDLPAEELDMATEWLMDSKFGNKEARELALAAIVQTNRLLEAINASMKMRKEEEEKAAKEGTVGCDKPEPEPTSTPIQLTVVEKPAVPCSKLTLIAAPLMKHLSGLLHSLQFMEEDLKRVRQELHQYKEKVGEMSQHSSPGGSIKRPPSAASCTSGATGKPGRAVDTGKKPACPTKPQPTTNIDDYLTNRASGDPERTALPTLTVQRCSGSETPGSRAGSPAGKLDDNMWRSGSGGSLQSSVDEGQGSLRLGASALTPAISPLSNVSSPEPRSTSGSSPRTTSATASPNRPVTVITAPAGENMEKQIGKAKVATPDSDLKSSESGGEGDEEKRKEKRRQKRQRHAALSGVVEGTPKCGKETK